MAMRLKGQDTKITVLSNNQIVSFVTDVRNFEMTVKMEKLEEQYLGEFSKRYDDIFHGADFKMDLHLEDANAYDFVKALIARAQGRMEKSTVNIQAAFNFSGGVQKILMLSECYFEDIPLSIGGRSEYGQLSLSGSSSQITPVT